MLGPSAFFSFENKGVEEHRVSERREDKGGHECLVQASSVK